MEKLNFSILIDAPKEKVWNTMIEDNTYRMWTEEFTPGSYYVGDWNNGSKFYFWLLAMMGKQEEWLVE